MRAALLILLALTLHTFAAPSHWAYTAPERPALPKTDSDWPRNPIDYFILAKQKDNQLAPSPTASPGQLLRRVHLDLTGLPPTPDVVAQFLENPSDTAYEKIVDDLLYSKHYGERWARPWLDLARYADSNGFQADQLRDSWAYRDWVIDAFNSGMPFNQFVIEQIAGDLLPNATPSQRIATGFHRTPTCNVEAGVHPEENRVNQVFDRVNTTGTVFLGTTLECAQCHDHKYDPFSIKDYYSLFAFFNNTPLEVKQNGTSVTFEFYGPTMDLPISTEQQKAIDTLNAQKKRLDQQLAKLKTDSAAQQANWEKATLTALQNAPEWSVLGIKQFSASGNPKHELQPDGSVVVTGPNPDKSTYTLRTDTTLPQITAIRLEALTHPSMHKGGPGRNKSPKENPNFIVNEFELKVDGQKIAFASVTASFSQTRWHVNGSIDGNLATGWAINPEFGKPATAIYKLTKPLAFKPGASLEFSIIQTYGGGRTIGRPRLSAMNGDPGAINLPDNIAAILKKTKRSRQESKQLTEYFQKENPQLKATETELAATNKKIAAIKPPTTLVMVEEDKPRETFIMQRGEYLNPGAKVTATTPEILHGMSADLPRNRLGFAKWLVAPQNPLLSRVTVNRWWAEIMGRGIVSTEEDFGTQSEPPTHPALLDWLSVEFIERGWSMRRIHKLIVMSATYRQSSRVTPAAQAADAPNKWHARAPRLRMSAEMVRDNALTISGLLSTKMHGPPVYPPQPGGIWRHVGRNAPKYVAATDEDRFRRGVYVVWRRGAPYVSFTNFDAPDRGACVVRRPRTNTPLQALTLLNDEAYVEMAMAFAYRITEINEATVDSRIQFAYRSALSREARAAEINYLKPLLTQRLAYFQKNPKAAADLVNNVKGWKAPQGADPTELAAWFYLANILLNLDETITKS